MTLRKSTALLAGAAALVVTALARAGCGGGSDRNATPTTTSGSAATIGVANGDLGKILVDSQGRTLYLFEKDSGTKSACSGGCATAWPPLRASGKPTAGGGAKASLLGTTPRSDGQPQVTYNGHPLYTYAADKKPGEANDPGLRRRVGDREHEERVRDRGHLRPDRREQPPAQQQHEIPVPPQRGWRGQCSRCWRSARSAYPSGTLPTAVQPPST